MNKRLILFFTLLITSIKLIAQEVQETTFIGTKNNIINAFEFKNTICDSKVLLEQWQDYIIMHGAKVNGGVINKMKGENFYFMTSGQKWTAYLAFGYNNDVIQDEIMNIIIYFVDDLGNSLSSDNYSEEAIIALKSLRKFNSALEKACIFNELKLAKKYLLDLNKKKSELQNRITRLDSENSLIISRVESVDEDNMTGKQSSNQNKRKLKLDKNQVKIKQLEFEINEIENLIPDQEIVIESFETELKKIL